MVTAWQAPRCNGSFVRKVYDGLGQLIQEQRPQQTWGATVDGCNGGNNSSEVDVNYLYDAFGRQTRASVPVATTLSYINRAAIWTQGYTETVYDATGRPARSFAPNDEQTDYGYAGRSTALFAMGRSGDPNKVVKWQEVDGLGYLKRLRTYTKPYSEGGSVQATIDLSHDVLGNLRTVTHPNSIGTTTIDYDLASRKISMSDPDLGSWSYTYNRQNQLISQTDGRDKTICLYYDSLERLWGKRFPSNSTCPTSGSYQVLYNYDQNHGTNNRSRGQLTYVSNGNFTKWLSYNNKGLLDYETVRILGASEDYTTTYGYDSYLRLNTLKYPDDEIVTTTYNSMGLPRTLTSGGVTLVDGDTNNDDDTTDTYDGANYDAAGRLVQMNFPAGGNLWQTRGYHGWTTTSASYAGDGNGRLYYIHTGTTKGGQDRLNLAYHYDSFGNLVYFHDNTAYHTLTYDEQNRITAAYSTSYGYDHSGRLTSYEGSSQPVNTTFPAHAIKKSGYSYDANGNLVARAGRTLNWDHENRAQRAPVSVTGGGLPNESYIYDDDGIRVKKYTNGTGTYDPFPHYAPKGHPTGSTITKYYFFGGQRIAMRKGGTLTYLHSDHLGSTVLETNTSGNPTANQQYCAYGRKRTLSNGTTVCGSGNSLATDHTFTGQKLDATGLQYFNARYYDPAIGTFISPDTLVPDATNVFDYNRYMMARGNPLKYTDPTGHCATLDDGTPDLEGDGACWEAANEWFATFGMGDYKNAADWQRYFAGTDAMTEDIFRAVLHNYWAPQYQAWGVYHERYNPPPQMHPVTREDQAFERMNDVIGKTICSTWDCVAIGLDVASIGLSVGGDAAIGCAVASAGAAAGVCIPAAVGAKSADIAVTGFSVARTWKMYSDNNASLLDGIVSTTTGSVSFVPGLGEAAGVVQLSYDLADPALSIFIPNRGAK